MQIVASLGLILVIQNGVVALWGPQALQMRVAAAGATVRLGPLSFTVQHFVIIGTVAATVILLHLFLTRSRLGTAIRATSQNPDAARVVGIDTNRIFLLTFMVASALAALGGALLGPLFLIFPQMGDLPLLKALTAIVLGGMGSVPGAVIGGLGHRHRRVGLDLVHPDRLPRHRGVRALDPRAAGQAVGTVRRPRAGRGLRCGSRPRQPLCWGCSRCFMLLPVVAPGQLYALHILTLALCYAVPAIGLNLLFGYTGLVSLGHMGFAGVGAYTTALLMKNGIVGFAPALLAGAVMAGLVGLLVGIPCLRLRSHFFIIVTLAVGVILYTLFNNLDALTGGAEGLAGHSAAAAAGPRLRRRRFSQAPGLLLAGADRLCRDVSVCSTSSCVRISAARWRRSARTRRLRPRAASMCSPTSLRSLRFPRPSPASAVA